MVSLIALALGIYLTAIPFGFLKPSVNDEKIIITVSDEKVVITSDMLRNSKNI